MGMELFTKGRIHYPDYFMQMVHQPDERFDPNCGMGERFRLVLVEAGSGILALCGKRFAFMAPTLFCLNERERPVLERSLDLKAQALYFHPGVINSSFNFDNLRTWPADFNQTDYQDRYFLRAFVWRSEKFFGQLQPGPASARQAAEMMGRVGGQLVDQPDGNWPCRGRSYLLELLFLLEHLRSRQEGGDSEPPLPLPEQPCDVEPVILYLHTHYRQKITLSELSRQFHTNRTTLEDRFAQVTGQPVMSYLISLRVRLAALMLRETMLPVTEVMERVGFSDNTHFGRTFRKYTGHSPREYRERYCWMI